MAEPRRALTAEERLAGLLRERRRLVRERLVREVAGARWRRMVQITPVLFDREGELCAHRLRASASAVLSALGGDAVHALDTALRSRRGAGFLAAGDVHVYVATREPLERLMAGALIDVEPYPDLTLVRPLGGPPRLLAALVDALPPAETLLSGARVISQERLRAELIGAVGARADLFALAE